MKLNIKAIIALSIPILFAGTGCNNKITETETETVISEPKISVEDQEKIKGIFKRSVEIHEMEANGKMYYVFDPQQLLIKYAKERGQDSYYKNIEVCVIGVISNDGEYGPLGRYDNQITIRSICE